MWRNITIAKDKTYVLNLVQDERRHRFCTATEVGTAPPGMVFQTRPIRGSELLGLRSDGALRIRFKLATGQDFVFGAHGEWFTKQERADMRERGWEHIRWVTGEQPALPPK
jgi:hypothetical protein